jgi:Ring finger domain
MIPMMVMGDPSTNGIGGGGSAGLLWAILQLYVSTLLCLIPLSICLLYSLLRLIKCQDASEASILCALAGCAFYGIVVSSLWKEDMEQQNQNNNRHKSAMSVTPIVLSVYQIIKIDTDTRSDQCWLHLERHENNSDDDETLHDDSGSDAQQQASSSVTCGTSSGSGSSSCYIAAASSGSGCVICLEPYTVGETVSIGPLCRHVFHAACLSGWTRRCHASCPCCRQDLQSNTAVAAISTESVSNGVANTATATSALLAQSVLRQRERLPPLEQPL